MVGDEKKQKKALEGAKGKAGGKSEEAAEQKV